MDFTLVDRIYECAFAPEFWPNVLDEVARLTDARAGLILTANMDGRKPRWTSSEVARENVAKYVNSGLQSSNLSLARLLVHGGAGFVGDHEVMSCEEIENEPLYQDVLWPDGLGNTVGTTISAPTGDTLACIVTRDRARGPVEATFIQRLDTLRPHLACSMLFSARLGLERARAATETLQTLGMSALVFDAGAKVLAANSLIEAERDFVQWRAANRVAFADKAADSAFHQAVDSIASDELPSVRSFAVREASAIAARVAHVTPVRGAARDIFARSAGVLMLTPVAAPKAPTIDLIRSLFDLTAAEAGVARRISSGLTLDRIARETRVSDTTVRAHLRAVFEKTGCHRQAEVVALMNGRAGPGG